MVRARDFLPLLQVNRRQACIAFRFGVNLGDFQPVGNVHPLRVDFRATDHRDLSG
jgi:hypothetical protein